MNCYKCDIKCEYSINVDLSGNAIFYKFMSDSGFSDFHSFAVFYYSMKINRLLHYYVSKLSLDVKFIDSFPRFKIIMHNSLSMCIYGELRK